MLRGQAKVDPRQGFSGSDSQDKSKPETEPKNGNHFGIRRSDGRSFCGRGSDSNLAVREQQRAKHRQAFMGVGITSSKHPILTKNANRECNPVGQSTDGFTALVPAPKSLRVDNTSSSDS